MNRGYPQHDGHWSAGFTLTVTKICIIFHERWKWTKPFWACGWAISVTIKTNITKAKAACISCCLNQQIVLTLFDASVTFYDYTVTTTNMNRQSPIDANYHHNICKFKTYALTVSEKRHVKIHCFPMFLNILLHFSYKQWKIVCMISFKQ